MERERLKILAGQGDWQKMQDDIDKFMEWSLNARETYPHATCDEKRCALRLLGGVPHVFAKGMFRQKEI